MSMQILINQCLFHPKINQKKSTTFFNTIYTETINHFHLPTYSGECCLQIPNEKGMIKCQVKENGKIVSQTRGNQASCILYLKNDKKYTLDIQVFSKMAGPFTTISQQLSITLILEKQCCCIEKKKEWWEPDDCIPVNVG